MGGLIIYIKGHDQPLAGTEAEPEVGRERRQGGDLPSMKAGNMSQCCGCIGLACHPKHPATSGYRGIQKITSADSRRINRLAMQPRQIVGMQVHALAEKYRKIAEMKKIRLILMGVYSRRERVSFAPKSGILPGWNKIVPSDVFSGLRSFFRMHEKYCFRTDVTPSVGIKNPDGIPFREWITSTDRDIACRIQFRDPPEQTAHFFRFSRCGKMIFIANVPECDGGSVADRPDHM